MILTDLATIDFPLNGRRVQIFCKKEDAEDMLRYIEEHSVNYSRRSALVPIEYNEEDKKLFDKLYSR